MSEQKVFYEIQSVRIKDHFPKIDYTETIVTEVNGVEKRIPKELSLNKSKFPAHKDFEKKLKALAVHFAILIDRIDQDTVNPDQLYQDAEDNLYDSDLLEGIEIRSVSIAERKGIKCVIITGIVALKNGRKITINTPLTELDETEAYRFGENLDIDISLLEEEAIKYLKGKYSEEQLSLNFSGAEEDGEEEEDYVSEVEFEEESAPEAVESDSEEEPDVEEEPEEELEPVEAEESDSNPSMMNVEQQLRRA